MFLLLSWLSDGENDQNVSLSYNYNFNQITFEQFISPFSLHLHYNCLIFQYMFFFNIPYALGEGKIMQITFDHLKKSKIKGNKCFTFATLTGEFKLSPHSDLF